VAFDLTLLQDRLQISIFAACDALLDQLGQLFGDLVDNVVAVGPVSVEHPLNALPVFVVHELAVLVGPFSVHAFSAQQLDPHPVQLVLVNVGTPVFHWFVFKCILNQIRVFAEYTEFSNCFVRIP